jgi:TonB-linked SusC/RagA family outer membrane protein
MLIPAFAAAQQGTTISGKVTSEAGTPLASVSVFIEGMNLGTITRDDGAYTIAVPAARATGQQATLTARLIGYKSVSAPITLSGNVTHDFVLAANPLRLGEVVVTGAGTEHRREAIGTVINTVDSSLIQKSNEPNIVNALAAKAPNVSITSQSGEPGASSYIRIRGIKSFSGNAQPLFIVDGVPIDNSTVATGSSTGSTVAPNRASDLNPNDIESINILKGPAAAAIYGAAGSEGVILITTKSGKSGPTRFSLRSSYSFDDVNRDIPLQRQFGQRVTCGTLDCGASADSYGPELAPGTPTYDHFNELFHTGHSSVTDMTVSGGNDRTTFYASAGYLDQNGTIIGPNNWYKKANARLKASHRMFDRLTISGNIAYIDANGAFTQKGSNTSGILLGGLRTAPDFNQFPYLDPETGLHRSYRFPHPSAASVTRSRSYDNPVFVIYEGKNDGEVNRTIGNINLAYDATDWLNLNYTLGGDYYSDWRLEALPLTSSAFPTGTVTRADMLNYELDHNLTAKLSHTFSPSFSGTLLLGQTLHASRYRGTWAYGYDLISPHPFSLDNTVSYETSESKNTVHTESYFGQATANLYDQLFLTATLRNDGFSTFGKSNPRAWYPQATASWTFSRALGNTDEEGVFSFGKLRVAYGETGKPPGVYQTLTTYGSGAFGNGWGDYLNATQGGFGGLYSPSGPGNDNLKPERQKGLEFGADLGFFDQKADLGITRYRNTSEDVILRVPRPPTSGYSSALLNGARIRNSGWEATLNVRPITTERYSWDFGVQWSKNHNEVLFVDGAKYFDGGGIGGGTFSGSYGAASVGYGFGLRGYDFVRCGRGLTNIEDNLGNVIANVDAACGGAPAGALYIDPSGFPVYDPSDRPIANTEPDWTGSFQTNFRYGKVSFSALIDHKQGGTVWNGTRGALRNFGTSKDTDIRGQTRTFGTDYMAGAVAGPGAGTPVVIGDQWFAAENTKDGSFDGGGLGNGFGPVATQFMEDGTYTRLREVSVAYTFDQPWVGRALGLNSIDLRVAGRNLAVWTDYKGMDPEANLGGAENLIQGIDYFNNPQTRSIVITVGLNR